MRNVCFALLAAPLVAGAVRGQVTVYEAQTPGRGDADVLGDLNGDGQPELLLGSWDQAGSGVGTVELRSVADGQLLLSLTGKLAGDGYGLVVAALEDLDGDGLDDFAVAAPEAPGAPHLPYVRVHSGATGQLLYELEAQDPSEAYGSRLVAMGDLDGDGVEDLALSSPVGTATWTAGYVEVVSGASGAALWTAGMQTSWGGILLQYGYGTGLAALGDLDGDGARELAVGYPEAGPGGLVEVRSGASGALLDSLSLPSSVGFGYWTRFGWSLGGEQDFDGDGLEDLVVSSIHEVHTSGPFGYEGPGDTGTIRVFRSSDWSELLAIEGTELSSGWYAAGVGDMDGDGVPDVLASAGTNRYGVTKYEEGGSRIYSGADGSVLLHEREMSGPLRNVGDLNLDGADDFVLRNGSNPTFASPPFVAQLLVSGGAEPTVACAAWPTPSGCLNLAVAEGSPSLTVGSPLQVRCVYAPQGRVGFAFWGTGTALKPFGSGFLCSQGPYTRRPVQATSGGGGFACGATQVQAFDPAYLLQQGLTPGTAFTVQFYLRDTASGQPAEVGPGVTVTVAP